VSADYTPPDEPSWPGVSPRSGEPPWSGEALWPGVSPEMRASDADRDQVIDLLRVAAGDGRLTPDELDERLEAALSSRTFGELAVLTADLVAAPDRSFVTAAQVRDVIRIDQRGGSVQRGGRWVVPRRLELRPSWCDVKLDFTDALMTNDTLRIDMNMRGGSLILVAGPGIFVDADDLTVRYTDIRIRPNPGPGTPIILRIELGGRMRYGWIEARWPQEAMGQ
jgi:DUF1707 SHOCT-like domain